jgi:hypothetical protein
VGIVGRLFGGEDLDETSGKAVEPVGARDVAVERRGIELRQYKDATDVGVQASADRHVDQPVLAPDRHGGLGACRGEGKQPGPLTTAENDGERVA